MVSQKQMKSAETERQLIASEKMTVKRWITVILGLMVAAVIRAVAVYSFIVPNNFAPGGVTGIASILEYKLHVNAGYFLLAMNVPLLVIAFIFIGKRFAACSGVSIVLSSVLMVLFEKLHFPTFSSAATGADQILPAIAGGILGGAGIAIMLKLGGSSGGTDIIATLVQKRYSATNIAWFIFLIDSTVVLASAFIYENPLVPILLSFVEMFASGKVTETILQGFKSAIKFEIITDKPEELSSEIFAKLHRGVTMLPAKGMYTGEDRAMLICILRKRQMSAFREVLKKFPGAFAYVSGTSEVMGTGFKN